jgi:hypothetical protein
MNLSTRMRRDKLRVVEVKRGKRPADVDHWGSDMTWWRVTFKIGNRTLVTPFGMGSGHEGRVPEGAEVMECLLLDAGVYEQARNFEDWCDSYGFDCEDEQSMRNYTNVAGQTAKLKTFLGDKFNDYVYETEMDE